MSSAYRRGGTDQQGGRLGVRGCDRLRQAVEAPGDVHRRTGPRGPSKRLDEHRVDFWECCAREKHGLAQIDTNICLDRRRQVTAADCTLHSAYSVINGLFVVALCPLDLRKIVQRRELKNRVTGPGSQFRDLEVKRLCLRWIGQVPGRDAPDYHAAKKRKEVVHFTQNGYRLGGSRQRYGKVSPGGSASSLDGERQSGGHGVGGRDGGQHPVSP